MITMTTTFALALIAICTNPALAQSNAAATNNNDPADGWVKVFEGETAQQMMSRATPIINGETMNFQNQDRATAIENAYKLAIAAMIKDPSLADRYGYFFQEGYAGPRIQDKDQLYRYLAKADFSKWPTRYLPSMLGMSREENRNQQPFSEAKRELALTLFKALKGTKDYSGLLRFIPNSELVTAGPIRDAVEDTYCSESILNNVDLWWVREYEVYTLPQGHHVTGKLPSVLEKVSRDRVRPRFEAMLATAIQKPSNRIPALFLSTLVKLKAGEDPAVIEPILAEATDLLEAFEKNRSYSNSFAARPGFIRQVGQMLESADSLASRDRAVLACYRHVLDAPKDMGQQLGGSAFQYFFKLLEYGQTKAARQFARQSLPDFCRPKSMVNGRPNPLPAILNPEAFAQIFVDRNLPIDGHAMAQIPLGRPADVEWMKTLAFDMKMERYKMLSDRARANVDSKAATEYLMERVSSVLNSGESGNNSQLSTLAPELQLDNMTRISTPVSSAFAVRILRADPSQTAEATATAIDQAKEKIQAALNQQPTSRPLAAVALALELTGDAAPSSTAVTQFISTMPKVDAFPANSEGAVPSEIAVASTDALNLLAMVDGGSGDALEPVRSYLKEVANRFGNQQLLMPVAR